MATGCLLRANARGLFKATRLLVQPGILSSRLPVLAGNSAVERSLNTSPQRHSAGMLGSTHWKAERVVSVALLGVIPVALAYPNPVLDCAMAASIILHCHWGMEQVFTDYIHGKTLPKVVNTSLLITSILAFASLCYFNYNDVGLAKAIALFWSA